MLCNFSLFKHTVYNDLGNELKKGGQAKKMGGKIDFIIERCLEIKG